MAGFCKEHKNMYAGGYCFMCANQKAAGPLSQPQGDLTELLSCPFCGGEAEIWKAHPENPRRKAWIACMSKCAVMTREFDTTEEAIATWNTRAR